MKGTPRNLLTCGMSLRTNARYGWWAIARAREKAGDSEGAARARAIAHRTARVRYRNGWGS